MDFNLPVQMHQCAPSMDEKLFTSLIRHESNFNPYAIGMDGKAVLKPQPQSLDEAVGVAQKLLKEGKTFSVGLTQIHISNVKAYGLMLFEAFDPCTSLKYGAKLYQEFYAKALKVGFTGNDATYAALRGYNSGNLYATVSNKYANAIMTTAAMSNQWQAQPMQISMYAQAGIIQPKVRNEGESIELFDK